MGKTDVCLVTAYEVNGRAEQRIEEGEGGGGSVPSLQLLGVFHNDHLKGVVALGSGSVHVLLQGLWVSALRGQLMGGLSTYQSVSK